MIQKKIKTHWNEQWVHVSTKAPTKNYDYEISNYGRIKKVAKESGEETLLKGSKMNGGLIALNLNLLGDTYQTFYIHKFVATHFIKNNDPSKVFVIHLDKDKNNNYWKNLQWINQAELTEWQKSIGVFDTAKRRKMGLVKLTETKVRLLKKRLKKGKTKKQIIAKNFNISLTQLKRIEKGENWGHVS